MFRVTPSLDVETTMADDDESVALMDLTSMSLGEALDDDDPRALRRGRHDDEDEDEGEDSLEDWLSQFAPFMMGVEYAKVIRVHPTAYKGIPVGGVLEDVYDPISEGDLAMKWGGGTFRVQVFKQKGGRSKVVDERNISVSGYPTHYRGPDGDPEPLPTRSRPTRERLTQQREEVQQNSLHGALGRSRADAQAETERARMIMEQNKEHSGLLERLLAQERQANQHVEATKAQQQQAMVQPFNTAIGAVQNQMAALQASHSSTLEGLRTNHSEQMRAMQETLNTYRDEAARRERDIRDESARRERQMMEDYKDRLEARILQTKESYEAQLREARAATRAAEDRHAQMLESERRHADSSKTLHTGAIQAQYEGTVNLLQVEVNRLRSENDRMRDETQLLRNKAMTHDDPLTALTKATDLVDMVRGKVGGDMPSIPEDSGFFGKLMQAAPMVSKAMGPILERVDKAAALGEESLRQQQQAMHMQQQQQQADPMGMGYQPIQQTHGLPSGQINPGPSYQQHAPPPPQQHAPPPPQQPQVPSDPTENFGEFLSWMDGEMDNPPEEIAQKIKAGVGSGVVPAEFVQGILMEDPKEIVSQIQDAAEQAGLDNLGSPLGKTILSRTLMELRK